MSLKQRLLSGAKSYGPLLLSDSPVIAELMASFDYGHIVVDHEHSPTDVRSGQGMLQAIASGNSFGKKKIYTEPIVRVASPNDPVTMKKTLDSLRLPGGILVPMIDDAEMAKQVVQSMRYPHQHGFPTYNNKDQSNDDEYDGGMRGCAVPFVRASGWGMSQTNEEYIRQCQEDLLVIVQVETPKGVEEIPNIAAVDGVDMIFLGPFDLSCSIGQMGNFNDKDVQDLIRHAEKSVIQARQHNNCLLGGFRSPDRNLAEMFSDDVGYSFVCGSIDLGLLREAAKQDLLLGNDAISSNTLPDDK